MGKVAIEEGSLAVTFFNARNRSPGPPQVPGQSAKTDSDVGESPECGVCLFLLPHLTTQKTACRKRIWSIIERACALGKLGQSFKNKVRMLTASLT